jgi:hypothetical protein
MLKTPALFVPGALIAIGAALAHGASAPPPPVTSTSSVTISGPGIAGASKTIQLPFMNNYAGKGDWYVLPNDAHAAFFVADKFPYSQAVVDLELNGAQKMLVITPGSSHPAVQKTDLSIYVTVGSTKFSTVDPGDQVTINVTKMDMLNFAITFSGTMTQVGMMGRDGHDAHRVTVSGSISLDRASAPAPINAGSWQDCDPIVHDWLNEAQNRASSDCEVKFDHHLQTSLNAALAPFEFSMQAADWTFTNKPDPTVLFVSAPRGSEKSPFSGQGFKLTMAMNPNSPRNQQAVAAASTPDPLMVREMDLMKQGKYAEAKEVGEQLEAKMKNAPPPPSTRLSVQVSFNQGAKEFINFHGSFNASPLPGGGTVLYLPAMQPLTGGANGEPGTLVLLGPWSQPAATHLDGDTTKVTTKSQMNPSAPRLSVQCISVYINADQSLAAKAIQQINWSQLRALLAQ